MGLRPGTTRYRIVLGLVVVLVIGAVGVWRYQSELIGVGARWYLARMAAQEEREGTIENRRRVLTQIHGRLLMPPPPQGQVAELFDFTTLLSSRVATGEISLNWAAYLYTAYVRNVGEERPDGQPRRTKAQLQSILDQQVQFFALRKRPDVDGIRFGDLVGDGGDTISLEEIEEAEAEGRELDLR
jgi:hypothetical protein